MCCDVTIMGPGTSCVVCRATISVQYLLLSGIIVAIMVHQFVRNLTISVTTNHYSYGALTGLFKALWSILYNEKGEVLLLSWFLATHGLVVPLCLHEQVQDLQNRLTSRSNSRKVTGEGSVVTRLKQQLEEKRKQVDELKEQVSTEQSFNWHRNCFFSLFVSQAQFRDRSAIIMMH